MINILIKIWRSSSTVLLSLLGIISFSLYYGNLFDRITSELFVNSSMLFQYFNSLGWIITFLIACIIVIGSFDFWIMKSPNTELDLVISMILIYFIAAISIGKIMKGEPNISGFILGFFTILYVNYLLYGILFAVSKTELGEYIYLIAIIKGFYGITNINLFLIKGIFINGFILGVFGYFWVVVFNTFFNNDDKKIFTNSEKICSPFSKYCVINPKNTNEKKNIIPFIHKN